VEQTANMDIQAKKKRQAFMMLDCLGFGVWGLGLARKNRQAFMMLDCLGFGV